ncbi:hypothetical protein DES53_11564 [Roseimicrobium gellanilyticum]|uniref:Uncharacterized protein n=1 Tax=Roseimicrobium gellanilyticum TaxID=748857 RepID=A0A366H4I7_9BACT|nr:hypothetical protein DES53_11564 [Roseimicrobium gellanilyticum]
MSLREQQAASDGEAVGVLHHFIGPVFMGTR